MTRFKDAAQKLELSGCLGLIHTELKDVDLKEVMELTGRDVKGSKEKILCMLRQNILRVLR